MVGITRSKVIVFNPQFANTLAKAKHTQSQNNNKQYQLTPLENMILAWSSVCMLRAELKFQLCDCSTQTFLLPIPDDPKYPLVVFLLFWLPQSDTR